MRKLQAAVGVALLSAAFCRAAEQVEKSEVSAVEVPMRVLDKHGAFVWDLRASEIVLKDQGHAQKILSMTLIEANVSTSAQTQEGSSDVVRVPRHYVFLFDLAFTTVASIGRAQSAAIEFVRRQLDPGDRVSAFAIGGADSSAVLLQASNDRQAMVDALGSLNPAGRNIVVKELIGLSSPSGTQDASAGRYNSQGSEQSSFLSSPGPRDESGVRYVTKLRDTKRDRALESHHYAAFVGSYLDDLSDLSRHIAGLPGRKVVILFSSGFKEEDAGLAIPGLGSLPERSDQAPPSMRDAIFGNPIEPLNWIRMDEAVMQFASTGCRVFSIDPGIRSFLERDPFGNYALLDRLSRGTGGEIYSKTGIPAGALAEVRDATSIYYLLTYTPPGGSPGKYRKISVDVKRPGVKVIHRKGYYEPKPALN